MKPITQFTERELAYTDPKFFLESLLNDPGICEGKFNINMSKSTWEGKINLSATTSSINRYLSAKIAYF